MSCNEQVVFRDYPLVLWFVGVGFLGAGAALIEASVGLVLSLAGVILIGFVSLLTITVDRRRGVLNLHYRSLFRGSRRAYPLEEICFVNVREDREGERMYRVELILRSGQVVPLRFWYEVGKRSMERQAQKLRSALGLGAETRLPRF